MFLQCLNRLNGNDAAVLGKQVLMFDEKDLKIYVQSLSHCHAHAHLANLLRLPV